MIMRAETYQERAPKGSGIVMTTNILYAVIGTNELTERPGEAVVVLLLVMIGNERELNEVIG